MAFQLDHVKRIWCLSPVWVVKVQASLCIRPVSTEPPQLALQAVSQREPSDRKLDP